MTAMKRFEQLQLQLGRTYLIGRKFPTLPVESTTQVVRDCVRTFLVEGIRFILRESSFKLHHHTYHWFQLTSTNSRLGFPNHPVLSVSDSRQGHYMFHKLFYSIPRRPPALSAR